MFGRKKSISFPKWLYISLAIFLIFIIFVILAYTIFENNYRNRIYPGVTIGQVDVSGLTRDEAKKKINQKIDKINQNGILFTHENNQVTLMPLIVSVEGDLAYQIINFDIEDSISNAFQYGRNNIYYNNLQTQFKSLIIGQNFVPTFSINKSEVIEILKENFSSLETPAKDAQLTFSTNGWGGNLVFDVEEEKPGRILNYEAGVNNLFKNLAKLDFSSIELPAIYSEPQIFKKNALNIDAKAKKILASAPLTLKYKYKKWWVNKDTMISWLTLKTNPKPDAEDRVLVGLNQEVVGAYLEENIAKETNRDPVDAKFEIKDGKVIEFQASSDGIELNKAATVDTIEYEIIENGNNEIEVVTTELKSQVVTEEINDFGIKENLGTGHSSFAGSPKNRRHNIRVGADTLNGVLIKPEEEFSLIKTLGEIDKESGYLPELVIKDNKTIPEYGGGLCQIGTTMFRAALATGLPITMRRNHSYRVSYYEPAGTDATIYNPWPDFRFLNNTGNYILIQSRIEGDDLYFDMWGTGDGRTVVQTEPVISNIVRPRPTKLIETLDLEPGEKKCTEHAHNGADAYFDYTVTDADGEIREKRFSSHYVPWREICLIGVEELSSEKATSTEEKTE